MSSFQTNSVTSSSNKGQSIGTRYQHAAQSAAGYPSRQLIRHSENQGQRSKRLRTAVIGSGASNGLLIRGTHMQDEHSKKHKAASDDNDAEAVEDPDFPVTYSGRGCLALKSCIKIPSVQGNMDVTGTVNAKTVICDLIIAKEGTSGGGGSGVPNNHYDADIATSFMTLFQNANAQVAIGNNTNTATLKLQNGTGRMTIDGQGDIWLSAEVNINATAQNDIFLEAFNELICLSRGNLTLYGESVTLANGDSQPCIINIGSFQSGTTADPSSIYINGPGGVVTKIHYPGEVPTLPTGIQKTMARYEYKYDHQMGFYIVDDLQGNLQNVAYQRIGDFVTMDINISFNFIPGVPTGGNIIIRDLPYPAVDSEGPTDPKRYFKVDMHRDFIAPLVTDGMVAYIGGTWLHFDWQTESNSANQNVTVTDEHFDNGIGFIYMSFTYRAAPV